MKMIIANIVIYMVAKKLKFINQSYFFFQSGNLNGYYFDMSFSTYKRGRYSRCYHS